MSTPFCQYYDLTSVDWRFTNKAQETKTMPRTRKDQSLDAIPKKKPEITTHLHENIPRLRKLRGLTQEGLAQKIGVTLNHIARIEAQLYEPSAGLLPKLMEALGVTSDELIRKTREMSDEERQFEDFILTVRALDPSQRDMLFTHAEIYKNKRRIKTVFLPIPHSED
jgi:transcriptional regulator with XRE-family HTH domain